MKLSTKALIGLGIVGAATLTVKAVKSAKDLIKNELYVRNSLFNNIPDEGIADQGVCPACNLTKDCNCNCEGDAKPYLIAVGDAFQLVGVDCDCGIENDECTSFSLVAVDTIGGLKDTLEELRHDELFERHVFNQDECTAKTKITPIKNSDLVEFSACSLEDVQCAVQLRLENKILAEPTKSETHTPAETPIDIPFGVQAFITVDNDPESIFNALCELYDSGVVPRTITLTKVDLERLNDDLGARSSEILDSDVVKARGTVPQIYEKLVYILNVLYQLGEVDSNGDLNFDIVATRKMIEDVNAVLRELGIYGHDIHTHPKDKETNVDEDGFHECLDIDGKPYEPSEDSEDEKELTDADFEALIEKIYHKLNPHFKKAKKDFKKLTENNKDLLDKAKKPVRHMFDEFNNIGK